MESVVPYGGLVGGVSIEPFIVDLVEGSGVARVVVVAVAHLQGGGGKNTLNTTDETLLRISGQN